MNDSNGAEAVTGRATTLARLQRVRGAMPPVRHNARTLAALTSNPGCQRRAVIDAAGVDKRQLASALGHQTDVGRLSSFAVARGDAFEEFVKADGGAHVLRLAREHLDLPVAQAHFDNLDPGDVLTDQDTRCRESQEKLTAVLQEDSATGTLFDHPLLQLPVGGNVVYLEPDLITFHLAGRYYVIEIKSFPIIDDFALPHAVAAAAKQSAVYVLAMRHMLQTAGIDPDLVSHEVLLVCPKDFTNHPTAAKLDVRKQLAAVRRLLRRLDNIDAVLDALPGDFTLDLELDAAQEITRPVMDLADSVGTVAARYSPECQDMCELAGFCRTEAAGKTTVLGRTVREDLGGIESIDMAMDLATGRLEPTPDLREAAELLSLAHRLRQECLEAE